jgi:hypothetical protein
LINRPALFTGPGFLIGGFMRIISQETSTNGRWGLTIVGDVADDFSFPAKGRLIDMGEIERHKTFQFVPDESGHWIDLAGETR